MLIWRDAMSTGHKEIDAANRQLIHRVNTFQKALGAQGPRIAIGLFLTGLYEQASINFSREDKVQRECNFTFHEVHKKEHEALLRSLSQISHQYDDLDEGGDHAQLLREVAALVKEWVAQHMVKSDVKLKPYWLRKNGVFVKSGW
ncbi:hemerythrin [Paramagnetospirillum kuznetsovii]|uniref:Hemerythrin n=1 Tax=Paramagnetospirillum kuznetsovii TaxID=2053833 RepID=A0A364NWP4_9PROT|nr:hemerythrin domain-containing protein [Paramagnetospirillum kuznetsovii]RAU21400.1 hemerythrin [Paramagnetospirillum kuznetsovii]